MVKRVALLHTSLVFFQRERLLFDLIEKMLPDVRVTNIVDDTILEEVMEIGRITPDITRRMCLYVLAGQAMGVNAVFNTCSSLGPTMDVARSLVDIPIVRIDDGMAEKAAMEGKKIGVLATVATTLKPTIDLIMQKAGERGTKPEPEPALCDGAFDILMGGDRDLHDDMVSQKAREVSRWADTLVLAQCSMARLAPRLSHDTGLPVLSSPELGISRLKQVLEQTV